MGKLPIKVYVFLFFFFPQRAKIAKQKEKVYLFKKLRGKKCAAGKFTGFETDLFFCEVHFNTRNLIREAGLLLC